MSIFGNLFGSSEEESREETSSDDSGCCSIEIEEVPEDETTVDAPPQSGTASETGVSEDAAPENGSCCCGSNEAEAVPKEHASV